MSMSVPTVTGFSSFWGMQGVRDLQQDGVNDYTMLYGRSASERYISRALRGLANRRLAVVMISLNGAAAGGAADASYKRVVAPAGLSEQANFGGARAIETVGSTAVTTSADETYIDNTINALRNMAPAVASYPVDLSGNGGGSKLAGP